MFVLLTEIFSQPFPHRKRFKEVTLSPWSLHEVYLYIQMAHFSHLNEWDDPPTHCFCTLACPQRFLIILAGDFHYATTQFWQENKFLLPKLYYIWDNTQPMITIYCGTINESFSSWPWRRLYERWIHCPLSFSFCKSSVLKPKMSILLETKVKDTCGGKKQPR